MSIKQTILVVDDEPAILDWLAVELDESYHVLVAKDGIEAVHIYERNIEQVSAIVTDLEMPRLNGRLVLEWVHHVRARLPVIVMSGSISNVELEELLHSPAVSFLAKPFALAQLEAMLRHALEGRLDEAA